MRIPLAEDDALLGVALNAAFAPAGFDVTWCRDRRPPLDLPSQQAPNALVLDVDLPVPGGLEQPAAGGGEPGAGADPGLADLKRPLRNPKRVQVGLKCPAVPLLGASTAAPRSVGNS